MQVGTDQVYVIKAVVSCVIVFIFGAFFCNISENYKYIKVVAFITLASIAVCAVLLMSLLWV